VIACVSAAILTACGGGEYRGDCAARLVWQGREYVGGGTRLPPELGEPLGEAKIPGCGGENSAARVVRVEGVDPKAAVAVPDDPTSVYIGPRYARASDADFPPPLARILLGPFCSEQRPFAVEGELSSSGLRERFQLRVEWTEPAGLAYSGLLVDIRLDGSTEGVNPQNEFSDSDRFRVRIHCVPAKLPTPSFLAERVTFLANGPLLREERLALPRR
jgi:Family of unknown function (DUF6281)